MVKENPSRVKSNNNSSILEAYFFGDKKKCAPNLSVLIACRPGVHTRQATDASKILPTCDMMMMMKFLLVSSIEDLSEFFTKCFCCRFDIYTYILSSQDTCIVGAFLFVFHVGAVTVDAIRPPDCVEW